MNKLFLKIAAAIIVIMAPVSTQAAVNYDRQSAVADTSLYDARDYGLAPCSAGGGGSTTLSGSDHVAAIYNFLTGKGLTPEQASGVMGNMMWESHGLEPERLQGHLTELIPIDQVISMYAGKDTSAVGWGLVQWTPFTKFSDAAKAAGKDPNLMSVQLDFLWGQLTANGFGSSSPEGLALTQLKTTSTPDDAAASFKQYYERSAPDTSLITRQVYAIAFFEFMKHGTPLPPDIASLLSTSPIDGSATSSAGNPNCPSTGTGGSGIGGYKNPFRDWHGIVPYRIDSGVDYDGQADPIYSIGNATVKFLNRSSNYAYNYLIYQFNDGPAAGLLVYISEQCDFPASLHVGSNLTADTVVCNYLPSNPVIGIEIGWSSMDKGMYNVYWNNTVTGGGGTTDSNGGIDFNTFLMKLGAPSGINHNDGPGNVPPPPASWPKW